MTGAVWAVLMLSISGGGDPAYAEASDAPVIGEAPVVGDEGVPSGYQGHMGLWRTYWGPEPQTCYSPRFGCYPGNNRFMHRYPAFHGYYYRRPYNYRQVFDYPWHAGLHEPTSHFSYNVHEEAAEEVPAPEGSAPVGVPQPPPDHSGAVRRRAAPPRLTPTQASAARKPAIRPVAASTRLPSGKPSTKR